MKSGPAAQLTLLGPLTLSPLSTRITLTNTGLRAFLVVKLVSTYRNKDWKTAAGNGEHPQLTQTYLTISRILALPPMRLYFLL